MQSPLPASGVGFRREKSTRRTKTLMHGFIFLGRHSSHRQCRRFTTSHRKCSPGKHGQVRGDVTDNFHARILFGNGEMLHKNPPQKLLHEMLLLSCILYDIQQNTIECIWMWLQTVVTAFPKPRTSSSNCAGDFAPLSLHFPRIHAETSHETEQCNLRCDLLLLGCLDCIMDCARTGSAAARQR